MATAKAWSATAFGHRIKLIDQVLAALAVATPFQQGDQKRMFKLSFLESPLVTHI